MPKIDNRHPIESNQWHLMFNTRSDNLILQRLRVRGFTGTDEQQINNAAFTTPSSKIIIKDVEFGPKIVSLFNADFVVPRINMRGYVAFSNININGATGSKENTIWEYTTTVTDEPAYDLDDSRANEPDTILGYPRKPGDDTVYRGKLVFKNISNCDLNLSVLNSGQYTGKQWHTDIVLDNVPCRLSSRTFGSKQQFENDQENGSEYHYYFYCINGTEIATAFPNIKDDEYNHIIYDTAPGWYNPNWDTEANGYWSDYWTNTWPGE